MIGRPTKMTDKFIDTLSGVLGGDMNAIALTDEELLAETNAQLSEGERISDRTFEYWKAGESAENKGNYDTFCALIKKSRSEQKKALLKLLMEDEKSWQRYAWIIERKFSEWNLKKLQESTIKVPDPIQVNLNLRND